MFLPVRGVLTIRLIYRFHSDAPYRKIGKISGCIYGLVTGLVFPSNQVALDSNQESRDEMLKTIQ